MFTIQQFIWTSAEAIIYGIEVVYWGSPISTQPVFDGTVQQIERNTRIRNAFFAGIPVSELAQKHQLSSQRVYQILRNN